MEKFILKVVLDEKVYLEYTRYCLVKSDHDKRFANAFMSMQIEEMMRERVEEFKESQK